VNIQATLTANTTCYHITVLSHILILTLCLSYSLHGFLKYGWHCQLKLFELDGPEWNCFKTVGRH